jgi:hypothetical protein
MKNNAANSEALVESRSLRDQYAGRTEVLDKVKKLSMLPDDVNVTVEMAANYYEVEIGAIKMITVRHREELEQDGMRVLKGQQYKDFVSNILLPANYDVSARTRSLTIIPRRAILRIGMLLRDSAVARAVRDYLLNVEGISRNDFEEVRKEIEEIWKVSTEVLNTVVKVVNVQNEMFGTFMGQYGTHMEQVGKLVEATTGLIERVVVPQQAQAPTTDQARPQRPDGFFKRTAIAGKLGLYSSGDKKPAAMAITCIFNDLYIPEELKWTQVEVGKDGKEFVAEYYHVDVIPRIRQWLKEKDYPTRLTHPAEGKTVRFYYSKKAA